VQIQQVLVNLLDNAIKYSTEGTAIGLKVVRVGDDVEVHVSNVGEGDEDDTSKPRRTDLVSDVVLRVGSSDQMHVVVLIPGASGQVLEMPGSHQSVVTGQERTSPQG